MNLERILLTNLERFPHGMTTVVTLWAEVSLDVPSASYTDFKAALHELQVKDQIVVIKGEDREKVKITDVGRARLLS